VLPPFHCATRDLKATLAMGLTQGELAKAILEYSREETIAKYSVMITNRLESARTRLSCQSNERRLPDEKEERSMEMHC
jgi:hypothetical protein